MNTLTTLPKRDMAASTTGCCPPFDPREWDKQLFEFKNKLFMKISTHSIFHMPLNMDSVMKDAMAQIAAAGAGNNGEYLMLSEEVSPWRANHYIAVSKDVPGAEMTQLNGLFMTRVFEGPFSEMRHWHEQLIDYVKGQGKTPIKTYFSYTTCPSCAKAYGKNYVIGFTQIA
jgi:hypothetical protein